MRMAVADCLGDEGYRVMTAENGEQGFEMVESENPDAIVLDVMMPGLDGFTLCRRIRELEIDTPILMLTARGQVADRVAGLDAGADDYLVKPCDATELAARVRALLRRFSRSQGSTPDAVKVGNLEVNFHERTSSEPLTPKEFAMLEMLVRHVGEVVSRDQFLDVVWGYHSFPTTRTVDNHVRMLRSKIESDAGDPQILTTVHGLGYRLIEFHEMIGSVR
ncbi:UNVERIFIED_CONTAM: hypothetical protein GTU68_043668 [Idotea baltica]|nr:hypothetical protein [Idotea baltica]